MNCQDDAELTKTLFDLCQNEDSNAQTLIFDLLPSKKQSLKEIKRHQQHRPTITQNTKFRDMESWKESKRIKYREGQGSYDPYSKKIGQDLL